MELSSVFVLLFEALFDFIANMHVPSSRIIFQYRKQSLLIKDDVVQNDATQNDRSHQLLHP